MLFLRYRVLTVFFGCCVVVQANKPTNAAVSNAILNLFIDKVPSKVRPRRYSSSSSRVFYGHGKGVRGVYITS